MMLEEVIELHWFTGFSPVQFLTKTCRLGEAVVAADQSMVIGCFGDYLAGLVDDGFHALPPVQRPLSAAAMVRNFINFLPASGVPMLDGRQISADHFGGRSAFGNPT